MSDLSFCSVVVAATALALLAVLASPVAGAISRDPFTTAAACVSADKLNPPFIVMPVREGRCAACCCQLQRATCRAEWADQQLDCLKLLLSATKPALLCLCCAVKWARVR